MLRARRFPRLIASALAAAAVVALSIASSPNGLGQPATQIPKTGNDSKTGQGGVLPANLLKAKPFDRLTLVDDSVWLIEPVAPRPLPPWDPAKAKADAKAKAKKDAAKAAINPAGNVGAKAKADAKKDEPIVDTMNIHLMEGEIIDFQIKKESIKKVEYFEDLLIAEGDRLIIAKDFAKAFEHYLWAKARNSEWRGLDERVDKLLFEEGSWALVEQDRERGVRLLKELSTRSPEFKNLADKLAIAYGGRINEAVDKGQYAYGRRILHDLEQIAPKNIVVREARDRFTSKAKGFFEQAEGSAKLEKLTETLRVLPTYEGAAEAYDAAFKAMPTLDVAVVDLPRPTGPFIRDPAGARVAKLLYLPLLAEDSADAEQGKLPNQLASGMETGDIGLRVDLKLKTGPAWSDGTRQVGAMDVVRALSDRAQPRSPGYSARWADVLDRVEVTDEQQVTVRFNRPVLQARSWFLGPIGPAHSAWDGRVPSADGKRKPVGDGPFVSETESDTASTYLSAAKDVSSGTPTTAVRRIREVRYPSSSLALAALARGEATLLEHVPADRVNAIRGEADIKLGTYTKPDLHRLALDGRNPMLKNRMLRRGMALAIDRKGILEESVLKHPIDSSNAPSDGPMPTNTYANAPNVAPYPHDVLLARMLVAAAKAEMKIGVVKLTLDYPAVAEAQAAAPKIVEALKLVGIEVTLRERSESELEEALRAGGRFDMAYRISKVGEPVWDIGPMLCPGFDAPSSTDALSAIASPRIMQLMLQLEHAPDLNSAKELVTQIDRESRDELPVIPLWQIEDHFAYRTRLKGPAEKADHLYQGIEQWQIEPWFAKDPW